MLANARTGSSDLADAPRWPLFLYGAIALAGAVLAFVGLSASGYWVDELFTMYIVDPRIKLAQSMQRILFDVHPPLYYFALDGWIALFGRSETATRAFSAICAVAALLVFAWSARRVARPLGLAFACAIATSSLFWFEQAQNARSYGWLMLLTAGLLAAALHLRRRQRESADFPWSAWLLLSLLGLAASQTHSYLLLGTGMLLLYLIATLPDLPLRIALAASGLAILGAYLVFLWFQLHATEHDFGVSWFRSDFGFIRRHMVQAVRNGMSRQAMLVVGVLLAVWLLRRWRRRAAAADRDAALHDADWAAGLAAFVLIGGIVSGIAVTKLVTPSFSFRNVLTFAPFAWLLLACLYDRVGPRARSGMSAAAVILIAALLAWQQVVLARGRPLPRNEPWRESAAYVRALPACTAEPLPAVALPEAYSGLSSGLRSLVADHYHGYYLPAGERVEVFTPTELLQNERNRSDTAAAACPLIAWNVHELGEGRAVTLAMLLAEQTGPNGLGIVVQEFSSYELKRFSWRAKADGFVFLRAAPAAPNSPLGERLVVVRDLAGPNGTRAFRVERWRGGRQVDAERAQLPIAALTPESLRDWRKIATVTKAAPR